MHLSAFQTLCQKKYECRPKIKISEKKQLVEYKIIAFYSKCILSHSKDITAASKHYSNITFEYLSKEYAI